MVSTGSCCDRVPVTLLWRENQILEKNGIRIEKGSPQPAGRWHDEGGT